MNASKAALRDYLETRCAGTGLLVSTLLRVAAEYPDDRHLVDRVKAKQAINLAVREAEQGLRAARLLGKYFDDTPEEA